jgi:hypothetical protein
MEIAAREILGPVASRRSQSASRNPSEMRLYYDLNTATSSSISRGNQTES